MRSIKIFARLCVLLALMTTWAACTDDQLGETSQEVVTTNLTTYTVGDNIVVNYTGMNGSTTDWITLALQNDPANTYAAWQYTGGGAAGSVTFVAPNLTPGTYVARAYYDWVGTNSFTIQQTSATFTVGGGVTPTIAASQAVYPAGATAVLNYSNLPGNTLDWVAVSEAGSPVTSYVAFQYTSGVTTGSASFAGLPSGNYEARAYRDNTYSLIASSTFSIGTGPTVSTDLPTYNSGQTVNVSWSNMPGNANDYVAVALAGSPAGTDVAQMPTGGTTSGTTGFTGLAAGSYEARAYQGGTTTILATSPFVVNNVGTPTISTDAASYAAGATVTVTYSGLPGNQFDWIAISSSPSPDTSYVAWVYTNGQTAGTAQFAGLPGGTFEARAYSNNSFTVITRSAAFTIANSGGACTVPPVMPVLSNVASGTLTFAANALSASAPLTVDLTTSILFSSVREAQDSPNGGSVVCSLHADDVDLGPAGVTCRRNDVTGSITVQWSVATFSSGVTVQRGEVNNSVTNPAPVTLTAVDPASSFVLLGGMVNGGNGWGSNEFVRATLTSGTSLSIETAVPGTTTTWQVVTMTGASVQRGSASFASGDTQQQVAISAAPNSFALVSYTTDNASSIAAATMMLQGSVTNDTTLDLSRTQGGSALGVSWEVVSLPFFLAKGTSTFAAGATTDTVAINGIQASTSIAMAASQSIFGQSGGSTSYAGAQADLVGEGAATLAATTNAVVVTRGSSQAAATIPWTVIDFSRDCNGN